MPQAHVKINSAEKIPKTFIIIYAYQYNGNILTLTFPSKNDHAYKGTLYPRYFELSSMYTPLFTLLTNGDKQK